MIYEIRRAKRKDIPKTSHLDASHINHRDICLVAECDGRIIGSVFAGLMRQNKQAYLEVHGEARQELITEALLKMKKLGVESICGPALGEINGS